MMVVAGVRINTVGSFTGHVYRDLTFLAVNHSKAGNELGLGVESVLGLGIRSGIVLGVRLG